MNKADWHQLRGWPPVIRPMLGGTLRPKDPRFGTDFAGVVEAVGKDVTELAPGDEVFGGCNGAFAEYVSAINVVKKPSNVTFEEAATMGIAGLTALQGLRDHGGLQPGERVLVNGASGGVGTLAVQIAKALGAHVTAVCSTRNVEQARALGADRVLDYTREDFTGEQERYDLILDVAGGQSWSALRRVLPRAGSCSSARTAAGASYGTSRPSVLRRSVASRRPSSSSRSSTSPTSRRSPTYSRAAS